MTMFRGGWAFFVSRESRNSKPNVVLEIGRGGFPDAEKR